MVVPLSTEGGNVYGGIQLYSAESRRSFDENDLEVAQMVAHRAASAIANAQAFGLEKRTSQRLRFLAKSSEKIFESFDVSETFTNLAQLLVPDMADFALIVRIEDGGVLRTAAVAHSDPDKNALMVGAMLGQRLLHPDAERGAIEALRRQGPIIRNFLRPESVAKILWPYLAAELQPLAPKSAMTIPLHSRGQTYGSIVAYYSESGRSYHEDDVPLFA